MGDTFHGPSEEQLRNVQTVKDYKEFCYQKGCGEEISAACQSCRSLLCHKHFVNKTSCDLHSDIDNMDDLVHGLSEEQLWSIQTNRKHGQKVNSVTERQGQLAGASDVNKDRQSCLPKVVGDSRINKNQVADEIQDNIEILKAGATNRDEHHEHELGESENLIGSFTTDALPETVYDKKFNAQPDKVYRMDSNPRGSCLIINNNQFDHFQQAREGSNKDMENLAQLFEKHLGFVVTCKENQTVKEMQELLKSHAQNASSQHCALAVVIMSHGNRYDGIGIICGKDYQVESGVPVRGTYIEEPELQQYFTKTNCPAMRRKPKLFIIHACRGTTEDKPEPANGAQGNSDQADTYCVETDDGVFDTDNPTGSDTADMHTVFASSPGYVAYRNTQTGSAFVEKYIQHVKIHAVDMEYEKIMKEIRNYFDKTPFPNGELTMPPSTTSLLKDLYLNPM